MARVKKKDKFDEAAERGLKSITLTMKIRRMLAGMDASAQGAILADLLSMYLAAHVDENGDDEATEGYRELVLKVHLEAVRKLIPLNYKLYVEPQIKMRKH